MNKKFFLILYVVVCSAGILLCLEIAAHLILSHRYSHDERSLAYNYDATLGWFPEKNSQKTFTATRKISIRHNSRGFRDKERSSEKTKPRIVFVGDSFVWGYDVEEKDRLTEKLQEKQGNSEVVNLGVSAYSTDQELLLLEREWDYYKPDFVFLIVSDNDRGGNASNMSYGYYKPYFLINNGEPQLKGVPVPKNAMYYFKSMKHGLNRSYLVMIAVKIYENLKYGRHYSGHQIYVEDPTDILVEKMRSFAVKKGAGFSVGLVTDDHDLEKFCQKQNIPLINFGPTADKFRFSENGGHWNEKGHKAVSETIHQFLLQNWKKYS